MNDKPNFHWKSIDNREVAILDGTPIYTQLWISISSPHDTESIEEIIKEVTKVVKGELIETDFSSGETTDFVHVFKDVSRLYPDFEKDDHMKMRTTDLLDILKQWKDFIVRPPSEV